MNVDKDVFSRRHDFLIVTLGRLLAALVAVFSLRIMTSLLEPSAYGQWSLLIAFQTFCTLFLINPVDQHLFRHAHEWLDEGTLVAYLARFEQYIRYVSIFIIVAVLLWWYCVSSDRDHSLQTGLLAAIAVGGVVYIGTLNIILLTLLNMFGFRNQSVIWMVLASLTGMACSVFCVMQYPHAISWILGQVFGAIVGVLGAWKMLRRHLFVDFFSSSHIVFAVFLNRSTLLSFCLPLAAATGFMWLQNTGYRFWVDNVWGAAELAVLVVGLGVPAQLTAIVESLAMQFLYPYFSRCIINAKSNHQTREALSDLMNVLAPAYAIWAGFNAICAAALLEVLTDSRYHAAIPFVVFGAVIEFMRCTTNLWSNTARAVRRTKGLIFPYGLGALVVWLGAIGVAYFETGLWGLFSVLVTGSVITAGAMIFFMQRLLPIYIDVPRLVFGCIVMSVCFTVAVTTPIKIVGFYENLFLLVISGVVTSFLIAVTLWRNPALIRLLSTPLRES